MAESNPTESKGSTFFSGQMTVRAFEIMRQHLTGDLDISAPPFNVKNANEVWKDLESARINAKVIGMRIPEEVNRILQDPRIQAVASQLRVPLPVYQVDEFCRGKASKVNVMVKFMKDLPDTNPEEESKDTWPTVEECAHISGCSDRIDAFLTALAALDTATIVSQDNWEAFLRSQNIAVDWKTRMDFADVLGLFGLTQSEADFVRASGFTKPSGRTTTYQDECLRWLPRLVGCYKLNGCVTDVVNLAYACLRVDPTDHSESDVATTVRRFADAVLAGDTNLLKVHTVYGHDMESDDGICWVILQYLNTLCGTNLRVIVQLPPGAETLVTLCTSSNAASFMDPKSGNLEALQNIYGLTQD